MTSTDSSASNNNHQSNTSDTPLDTSSKAMNNENECQVLLNTNEDNKENTDTNNMSSSEASSSPSAPSPSSSSPSTSSNNTSTDKAHNSIDEKSLKDPKSSKTHFSKKASYNNQNQNGKGGSMDHSPIASATTSTQQSQQFVNYYPAYVPRQGQAPQGTQPYDANGQQQWPPAMAAAAAMAAMAANDPMAIAAYMNGPNGMQNGAPYPPANPGEMTQQHYDQFSFGFTPAFGFGYAGNGNIDYAAIQASQHGSNLNPQSNQWTPSNPAVPATSSAASNPTNPSLSPANTTISSNDTTPSVPSTTASETSAANQSKWVQVMQDPNAVHEFNTFQPQQLSPGDMYIPQHHHQPHHNYRSHHHYPRHQHMQSNYHHYQYNNPYHMPHYQGQYNMQHQMQHHHYGQKNYNNNYNKSSNQNSNNHDNNNNSNKSNNLNSVDDDKQKLEMTDASGTDANESKGESGSKSWASIVGVSTTKSSASTTPQTAVSSPTMQQNDVQQLAYPSQYSENPMLPEYSNYMKPRNSYYKNNYKQQQNNYESSNQQIFDLTNRSFPPIGDDSASTKSESNENPKKSSIKNNKSESNFDEQSYQNHPMSQNSRKQQQYYNYQRQQQQQFNLPVTKFNGYHQNGQMNFYPAKQNMFSNEPQQPHQHRMDKPYNGDKPYKGEKDSYYKRHQPSAHTLSSFLNVLDKTKFDDTKSAKNNTNTSDQSQINGAAVTGDQIDELSQQTINLQIDPSQLQVFTNPSAYNPAEFNTSPKAARFFVIKSYSEDDIHRSIKYNIWCSTEHGNRRLDSAYFKGDGQVPVYLFYSVNGSGHFCGMAEMQSRVDYNKKTGVWSQDKWRGCLQVKWIYVKDVPNSLLRNIKLENNDNKPVTNSRDTQEIPYEKGRQVLKVFHTYNHTSSILDDFEHYERKQEEDKTSAKIQHTFEKSQTLQKEPVPTVEQTAKPESVQDSVTSSPSTSSSSSTYSIDESKKLKTLEQPQTTQLIASSS